MLSANHLYVPLFATIFTFIIGLEENFGKVDATNTEQVVLSMPPPFSSNGSVNVYVGFYVESLGNLKATEMSFDMDIYLHLSWSDSRLAHNDREPFVINDISSRERIWTPDLYFANAKTAHFQYVTVPNFAMFIEPNGVVAYSSRVTMNVACNLDLKHYPLDSQQCFVKILSYANVQKRMNVRWFSQSPIRYNNEIDLPEFILLNMSADYCNGLYKYAVTKNGHKFDEFSCLMGKIELRRAIGYHLVQTYLPTALIVLISWVSFWIDRNVAAARVSLSFTTLLTLSTMAAGLRFSVPAVSYAKAIDYWCGFCMLFVFGALVEFALVNNLMRRSQKFADWAKEGHLDICDEEKKQFIAMNVMNEQSKSMALEGERMRGENERKMTVAARTYSQRALFIDQSCRVIFPLSFLVINCIYWTHYLL